MIKNLKKIRPNLLIYHIIITLSYPTLKALTSSGDRLLVFTDAMTIIALILMIVGIINSMILHGDFDISSYYIRHGGKSLRYLFTRNNTVVQQKKSIDEYLNETREKREGAFNYPLFLGIVYLLSAAVIAYVFYP